MVNTSSRRFAAGSRVEAEVTAEALDDRDHARVQGRYRGQAVLLLARSVLAKCGRARATARGPINAGYAAAGPMSSRAISPG